MAKVDLVISGGSVEGICTATGFLRAVVDDLGHEVACGAGNSAGGIVLACHASGMSPAEIEKVVLETDFRSFVSVPSWWNVVGAAKALRRGWLSDGNALSRFLESSTKAKKLKDAAFDLRLVGSNFTRYRLEEFHKGNRPEMPVWLAARITACLPMAFKPVEFEDCLWYDGGVRRHYPVDAVPPSDRPFYGWLLGEISPESKEPVETRPGALGVLADLVNQGVDSNVQDAMLLAGRKPVTVSYDDAHVGTFDFGIGIAEKKRLVDLARKMTVEALGPKG